MKLEATPFVKFFIITCIFTFALTQINSDLVDHFLRLRLPLGEHFIPTQFLTYQLVPENLLDLIVSSFILLFYVSRLERYYGTLRITSFFFLFGIINSLFIQVLGVSTTLSGYSTSFVGFGILYILNSWDDIFDFFFISFKWKLLFIVSVLFSLFCAIRIVAGWNTSNEMANPTNFASLVLACLLFFVLDGKIRDKKF